MTKLGAIFLPSNPPELLPGFARAADDAGLEQLWLWEDCFLNSGIAAAAAALASTSRLQIGIGILPVPFRNVALAAMEVATLRRMFGERAIVGIGHGVQDWMEQVGVKAASPMGLLREYAVALQALLNGERVTTQGRYVKLDDVALDWPPTPAPKVLIGATGPKTLQLAGELAGGTILTGGTTPAGVLAAKSRIEAGGGGADHEIVVFLPAAAGPDGARRLADQQRRYGTDDPGVAGDAKAVAEGIEPWIEAGATTIVLQPTSDDPDPQGFLRFVAQEVRPLVS